MDSGPVPSRPTESSPRGSKTKIILLVAVVVAVIGGTLLVGDALTLESLASHETELRAFQQGHPLLVYGLAFGIYVVVTGLSLPGAAVLTLVYGWYFGLIRGVVLVSFASTLGATIAFLISRYLLRDSIQDRFGDRLTVFNENLRREGAFYLLTLRLIPAVPFFIINVVMGLTPMKVTTYWWVSQVGMFAGTIAFVYAGSSVPDLQTLAQKGVGSVLTWRLLGAFVVLGTLPLIAKFLLSTFRRSSPTQETT